MTNSIQFPGKRLSTVALAERRRGYLGQADLLGFDFGLVFRNEPKCPLDAAIVEYGLD